MSIRELLPQRQGQPESKVARFQVTIMGPCTQIVYTLTPKYLNRDYFKAKVSIYYLGTSTRRVRIIVVLEGIAA